MATKVSIVSLGCAKNQVDAEMLFYKIREAGYEISEDPGVCDVAILREKVRLRRLLLQVV